MTTPSMRFRVGGRLAGRPAGLLVVMVAATIVSSAPRVLAHEYWLSPSRYVARAGDPVAIASATGEGFAGPILPYARARIADFHLRSARIFPLAPVAAEGDSILARFVAADDSGTVVVLLSTPSAIELPADKFETYLVEDGLEAVIEARARAGKRGEPGRERFRRCAKTWIAGTVSASRLLRPAGLPFEIVPIHDPGMGETHEVSVLFDGEPIDGVLVHAWRQPLDADLQPEPPASRGEVDHVAAVRTDARGRAVLALSGGGEWLVSAVHMVPSTEPDTDWESYWASLTFARP
jgi:uncharacterized GH25 family protein